jgi:PAS domain S-box-containing protein
MKEPEPGNPPPPSQKSTLRDDTHALEILNAVGRTILAELDLDLVVQKVTDAATELTGAAFGAFFYNVLDERGEAFMLYTLSGVEREDFADFPMPRNTAVFAPTFTGESVVRSDDITKDPRYGKNKPYRGYPKGHLPVHSYLAVPVKSRSGEVLGGLFFGHPETAVFDERAERLVTGIAAQAAIALDNARLYEAANKEIADRKRVEAALRESEERFRLMANAAPVMIWMADGTKGCSWVNDHWLEFTGRTLEEETGSGWAESIHADDVDTAFQTYSSSFDRRTAYRMEYRMRRHDGQWRWIVDHGVPLLEGPNGEFTGFIGSCTDFTDFKQALLDRERLLESEQDARSEAERLGRLKDEFLATLSHELRTPLNAIVGWSSVLKRSQPGSEDYTKGVATIARNARVQVQIIDDLLDMSGIISGKIRLDIQPVYLHDVITTAIDSVRPSAQVKELRLHATLDEKLAPIRGDPARLHQILWNLLTNAVKFTPKGGSINVVLERASSNLEVTVEDSGTGIDPSFLPFVFERFRQSDASPNRRHGGLGLGLSIVKHLVELHGGSVDVKSPGAGKGSTFTVSFPVSVIRADESEPYERRQADGHDLESLEMPRLDGVSALVVEDEADSLELIGRLIEENGGAVIPAASGAEALEVLEREQVDILVSDIGMPELDGYELIRRVRNLRSGSASTVPAIALTAYARAEDRQRVLLSGFQMHLAKPIEPRELVAGIASLLQGRGQA